MWGMDIESWWKLDIIVLFFQTNPVVSFLTPCKKKIRRPSLKKTDTVHIFGAGNGNMVINGVLMRCSTPFHIWKIQLVSRIPTNIARRWCLFSRMGMKPKIVPRCHGIMNKLRQHAPIIGAARTASSSLLGANQCYETFVISKNQHLWLMWLKQY